jgi:hypothetical protein
MRDGPEWASERVHCNAPRIAGCETALMCCTSYAGAPLTRKPLPNKSARKRPPTTALHLGRRWGERQSDGSHYFRPAVIADAGGRFRRVCHLCEVEANVLIGNRLGKRVDVSALHARAVHILSIVRKSPGACGNGQSRVKNRRQATPCARSRFRRCAAFAAIPRERRESAERGEDGRGRLPSGQLMRNRNSARPWESGRREMCRLGLQGEEASFHADRVIDQPYAGGNAAAAAHVGIETLIA